MPESEVQLRPELAVNRTPIDFAVEQNAVAHMSDAFRRGLINADDIIERYGTLAQAKEKAQIQGLDEFISPQAIAARKNQSEFMSGKAKSELALLPVEEQARISQLHAIKLAAEQGDNAAKRKFVIEHGGAGFLSKATPGQTYTSTNEEQDNAAYKDAVRFASTQKAAEDVGKDIDRRPSIVEMTKGGISTVTKDPTKDTLASKTSGVTYTPEEAKRAKFLSQMTQEEWVAEGRPTAGQFIFGVESKVAAPAESVDTLVTPRQVTETKTTKPDGSITETKKVVEPTSHPSAPEVTARDPNITSYKETPVASTEKAPTEAQQRAELALARFGTSNDVFEFLTRKGYDPTEVTSWVNSFLPEILKSGDRKTYDSAVDAWSQGLLRLESGAAISKQEKNWYDKAFFPQVKDPPVVVENKAKMRKDIERMVAEIAQAGGVVSPESAAQAKRIYAEAGNAAGETPQGVAVGGKIIKTRTGRSFQRQPDGSLKLVK